MIGYTTERRIKTMTKDMMIITGVAIGMTAISLGCYEYNAIKEQKLKEKKAENERLYFDKLTPEQVENLEKEKLQVRIAEINLKKTEGELKKTVVDFKNEVKEEIKSSIQEDIRDTFDKWSSKYEDRLDKKVDRVVSRIDDLSDKYGGVKATNAAPSISVVNAPNN